MVPPKRGRTAIYNWPGMVQDGKPHTLHSGTDFRSIKQIVGTCRSWARDHGHTVRIQVADDRLSVTVQFNPVPAGKV